MKTVIYYFTGTGNTLAVARGIAESLGNTKLIPLRRAVYTGGIPVDADAVGIAFPVYYLDMPAIVRQFVQQLRFAGTPYVFGIATCGARPGGALFCLAALLGEKGVRLSSGFVFVMPENYIGPLDLMEPPGTAQEKNAMAQERIAEVAGAIRDRKESVPEGSDSRLLRIGGSISRVLMTSVYRTPRRLHATEACNRCGICGRICPTRNITVTGDAVTFGGACTQCYACVHWCPKEAIQIGGRTKGKQRYHHPDVTLKDMLEQRGE